MPTANEARSIGRLLCWITGNPVTTSDEAREDAVFLADRAYKTLLAGMRGEQVIAQWPDQSTAEQLDHERNRADLAEGILRQVTQARTREIDGAVFVAADDLKAIAGLGAYAPEEADHA